MPDMDGYETIQHIRANPATTHIPLIAVTAKAMKGDRQKCLVAGASDYIAKPVDVDLLLALLRVWVTKSRNRAQGAAQLTRTAAELPMTAAQLLDLNQAEKPDGEAPDASGSAVDRARVLVV